ncbi:endonuclease-reverse transcriptase [Elysia marginata]|uniref:Endonuclease-reverse transcriptase n=1 Tax=Elysia marginata TaxID=1093978 RepID=A0AAV4F903_9GAST|nr:endonuclease-reverse transcriptase [Elysia marginata]
MVVSPGVKIVTSQRIRTVSQCIRIVSQCIRIASHVRNVNGRWPEVVSNEELWDKRKQMAIDLEIRKQKWNGIGYTLGKPVSNITKQALNCKRVTKTDLAQKQSCRRESCQVIGRSYAEQPKRC